MAEKYSIVLIVVGLVIAGIEVSDTWQRSTALC